MENNQVEVVDVQSQEVRQPELFFDGLDAYEDVVGQLKSKFAPLIEQGLLTEKIATVLMEDYMLQAFKQLVKLNYR